MAKLMDIKGYWNRFQGQEFNDRDMWEGQILLEDDGWFEGIAVDPNSSYTEDRFLFGIYHPGKIIELFKSTPINRSAPLVFHGVKGEKGYVGQFETLGFFGTTPWGNSRIITQEAKAVRQDTDKEIQTLEAKIKRYKEKLMDGAGYEFYNDMVTIRKNWAELVLKHYEGERIIPEEAKKLLKKRKTDLNELVLIK